MFIVFNHEFKSIYLLIGISLAWVYLALSVSYLFYSNNFFSFLLFRIIKNKLSKTTMNNKE